MSKSKVEKENTTKSVNTPEPKYNRKEILVSASSFDVMPEVLAGALSTLHGDEFTRNEIEKAIGSFKKRKVK